MELWIRSQDKEHLLKVSTIYYQHGIAADYNGNEIEHFCVLGVCNSSHYELGIYKSKERALEVIDEIQKILHPLPKNIIKNSVLNEEIVESLRNNDLILASNQGYNFQQLNSFVYEMPKE